MILLIKMTLCPSVMSSARLEAVNAASDDTSIARKNGEVHPMTAFISLSLILILAISIIRWIAAVPLMRALTASIDHWADSVQGQDAESPR